MRAHSLRLCISPDCGDRKWACPRRHPETANWLPVAHARLAENRQQPVPREQV
jgi:hypothetical protein